MPPLPDAMTTEVALAFAQIIPVFFLAFAVEATANLKGIRAKKRVERRWSLIVKVIWTVLLAAFVIVAEYVFLYAAQRQGVAEGGTAYWFFGLVALATLVSGTAAMYFSRAR